MDVTATKTDNGAQSESCDSWVDGPKEKEGGTENIDSSTALKPLSGLRLAAVAFAMLLGFFLATVETSITATALVSIGEYFNDSFKVTWIVLSYLLSYMGFSVIIARLSDGIGRKKAIIFAWILFSGFSLASGLAQSMNQLIVFRAIQGIGGSGLFSMTMIVLPQVSPVRLWGLMSGLIGMCFACSSVVGPILGGVITQRSTWRWIYLFNAPAAVIGVGTLLVAWQSPPRPKAKEKGPGMLFAQMDIPGALLLLVASTLLVFALEEAGSRRYDWDSPAIIVSLVISATSCCAFIAWIFWLDSDRSRVQIKPIFPLSVALKRPTGPAILMSLLTGFPFFVVIINLPLQFQVVNGDTPIMAGVHLLPLLAAAALGSTLGGVISSKKNLTSYCLIVAACLMLLGCGLLSTISSSRAISSSQYGYQFILGFGVGLSFTTLTMIAALSSTYDTVASAQGAMGQARVLGGNIGLAIATIIFNQRVSADLSGSLSATQLEDLQQSLSTISSLDKPQQAAVATVFSNSFNEEMRVCTYLSAVGVIVALFTWERNPASVAENKARQTTLAESQV